MKRTKKINHAVMYTVVAAGVLAGLLAFFSVRLAKTESQSSHAAPAPVSRPQNPGRIIYLTFDMDMNETMSSRLQKDKSLRWYDPDLVAYLENNTIQATFFVSGLFAETYPALLKGMASDPNFSFQNHAYDESGFIPHCYWLSTLKTDKDKISQIEKTQGIIAQATGETPKYFRYPGICHDKQNDALVSGLGFKISNGTVIPGDPFNSNTDKMVKTILDDARNGSVVIMHVGGPNAPKSLEVLKQAVPKLVSKGYSFAKL